MGRIPFRLDVTVKAVRESMKKYASVPMDLADACLVHLAEQTGSGTVLSLDRDFEVHRWRRTRRFDRLPRM